MSIWSSRDGRERLGSSQLYEQDPSKRRRGSGGGRQVPCLFCLSALLGGEGGQVDVE